MGVPTSPRRRRALAAIGVLVVVFAALACFTGSVEPPPPAIWLAIRPDALGYTLADPRLAPGGDEAPLDMTISGDRVFALKAPVHTWTLNTSGGVTTFNTSGRVTVQQGNVVTIRGGSAVRVARWPTEVLGGRRRSPVRRFLDRALDTPPPEIRFRYRKTPVVVEVRDDPWVRFDFDPGSPER